MSADRRLVATDALATLGTILAAGEKRDAIHLAVEPVIAGDTLHAGDHVSVEKGIARLAEFGKGLGIVDPFIEVRRINPGERFWFVMYPRMVHSLRHVWTHPAFDDEAADVAVEPISDTQASAQWIEEFARQIDQTVSRLMEAADLWRDSREYTYDNSERYKDHFERFPEFWKHYAIVRGVALDDGDDESFFTCSC